MNQSQYSNCMTQLGCIRPQKGILHDFPLKHDPIQGWSSRSGPFNISLSYLSKKIEILKQSSQHSTLKEQPLVYKGLTTLNLWGLVLQCIYACIRLGACYLNYLKQALEYSALIHLELRMTGLLDQFKYKCMFYQSISKVLTYGLSLSKLMTYPKSNKQGTDNIIQSHFLLHAFVIVMHARARVLCGKHPYTFFSSKHLY